MHNKSGILITSGALQKPEMILARERGWQEMARGIKNTPKFSISNSAQAKNQKEKKNAVIVKSK